VVAGSVNIQQCCDSLSVQPKSLQLYVCICVPHIRAEPYDPSPATCFSLPNVGRSTRRDSVPPRRLGSQAVVEGSVADMEGEINATRDHLFTDWNSHAAVPGLSGRRTRTMRNYAKDLCSGSELFWRSGSGAAGDTGLRFTCLNGREAQAT